jgi:hypothetical protein
VLSRNTSQRELFVTLVVIGLKSLWGFTQRRKEGFTQRAQRKGKEDGRLDYGLFLCGVCS